MVFLKWSHSRHYYAEKSWRSARLLDEDLLAVPERVEPHPEELGGRGVCFQLGHLAQVVGLGWA